MTSKRTKRLGSLLLSLIMVLSLGSVFCFTTAFAESDGEWIYTVNNGKATITSYRGTDKNIVVPSKIGGLSVSTVNGICTNNSKTSVVSIKFETGISELGNSVCSNYTSLEQVTLPDSLRVIGASAFASCNNLRGIVIPASVTSLGENAFQNCFSLYSAVINCSITSVPKNLFAYCSKLGNVTLPESITEIQENAFTDCKTLANINLPNSIKTIGKSAFANCYNLSGVLTLPTEIKTIDENAFYNCSSLNRVIIPNKIKDINHEAFRGCTSLNTVLIGTGIQKIGENAFFDCTSLDKVVFGGTFNNLNTAMDFRGNVHVYYPSAYADKWGTFSAVRKTAYSQPKSVSISGKSDMTANSKQTLKITVSPNTSVIGKCYYLTSSNPSVATVDENGLVTSKTGGKTTITATTINGVTEKFVITVKPAKVTGVDAVSQTTSSVQVSWKSSGNVTGYIIYRSTKKSSGFKKVGTSLTNSYVDKGLTKGSTYYYRVKAYSNANGEQITSANSSTVSIKVSAPTPTTVSAKKSKSKVAQIKWSKSIGAQGYQIYMASSKNGKFEEVKTITTGSTLSYKKTGLKSGKTYYFKVRPYITVNGKKVYGEFTKVVSCKV